MIMLKTEPSGDKCTFGIRCDACGEPILSRHDGVFLFRQEQSVQGFVKPICTHKTCQDKIPNAKSFMAKDLAEFFKVFLPDLRFDEDS